MLNQKGLIPGPREGSEAFIKRVDYSLDLINHLPEEIKVHLSGGTLTKPKILLEGANALKKKYDSFPDWTLLFFSNYKLPYWHGGCAWIFQMMEDNPTSALIQLREAFSRSSKYLGIYDRKELLAHELCHVGRMMFQEPKFEEILAYRTANSSYRRWLGPLFQSSIESSLFLLFLFMLIVFDSFLLASNRSDAYFFALWLKVIPVGILIALLGRLWIRQKTYASCIENLKKCVVPGKEEATAFRLQDHEIILFSKSLPEQIKDYASLKSKDELRWQVIKKAYF